MRKLIFLVVFIALLCPSCSKKTGTTITVVKPKYHHRFYDRKKDKRMKRTRTVKVRN